MSYLIDMTWILQHQVYLFGKMSYPCHIHVISVILKRRIWIYLVYPKSKQLHLVYTRYIISCHMPSWYLSMSYPCHKFVRLSGSGQEMNFGRKLHCGLSSAYRSSSTTRFICHCRARWLLLFPLPWMGTPPARAPASLRTPPARGPPALGPASFRNIRGDTAESVPTRSVQSEHRLLRGRILFVARPEFQRGLWDRYSIPFVRGNIFPGENVPPFVGKYIPLIYHSYTLRIPFIFLTSPDRMAF